ncbi:AraC family transcriptional regulator [Prauserella flavalba]|uniref:HTH araC/xylS-type domain-containing protein n=1 Tax=Prauserella flavalba TaxID=1477506 RepID=A0A318LJN8_9PSEU|nr:AraC family transcriptional regulator [Prauserella flavalba]PXY24066.1 hypothetical protein BA062_27830 [Prauserella flavalba]
MGSDDVARYWRHPGVAGVDLLRARFVRHAFARHSHETFAIGVIESGAEELRIGSTVERVTAGGTVLLNPEVVHTGAPADADGWTYRVLYLPVAELASLTGTRGTPVFAEQLTYDRDTAAAVLTAHRAAESPDRLTAGTLLDQLLARLWHAHGSRTPAAAPRPAGRRDAERARQALLERMAEPPPLAELAAEFGTSRFALLRAFRARFGLPPHTYLNQHRVRTARSLLARGVPPAEAAVTVGFVDQAHLSRHFTRIVGVPPGAYARAHERTSPDRPPRLA